MTVSSALLGGLGGDLPAEEGSLGGRAAARHHGLAVLDRGRVGRVDDGDGDAVGQLTVCTVSEGSFRTQSRQTYR